MVASMLRVQRRNPAKAQAKCAFATNYPLANRQLRSPLILRYRMQRDKPFENITRSYARQRTNSRRGVARVLSNCPPAQPHGALTAAVHFAPQLITGGLGENGRMVHLQSLEWLIGETASW